MIRFTLIIIITGIGHTAGPAKPYLSKSQFSDHTQLLENIDKRKENCIDHHIRQECVNVENSSETMNLILACSCGREELGDRTANLVISG